MGESQVKKMSGICSSCRQFGELFKEQNFFQLVGTEIHAHEAFEGLEVAVGSFQLGLLQVLHGQGLAWPENEQVLI